MTTLANRAATANGYAPPVGKDSLDSDRIGPDIAIGAAQIHRARLAVCARAHDADDARTLLAALGLLETA